MTATAAMVTRLRRMVAEATTDTYDDDALTELIELYPVLDSEGMSQEDDDWIPSYDLNAAAGDVWMEKAASLNGSYDFGADGSTFSRSQTFEHAKKMARHYGARRQVGTIVMVRETVDDDLTDI